MNAGNDGDTGARDARRLIGGSTAPAGEVTASFPSISISEPPTRPDAPKLGSVRDPAGMPPATGQWKPPAPLLTSGTRAADPQFIERVMEAIYRWRTVLGIGLAATMTLAVVVTYWARSGPGADSLAGDTTNTALAGPDTALSPFNSESATPIGSSPTSPTGSESAASSEQTTTQSSNGQTTAPSSSSAPTTSEAKSTTTVSQESTTSTDDTIDPTSSITTSSSTPTSESTTTTSTATTTTVTTTVPTSVDPTTSTTADLSTRVEAETGTMLGQAQTRSDHGGFSGTGFVGDIITQGSGVELEVDSDSAGPIPFLVRYAAGDVAGKEGSRTLTVLVNGTQVTSASMALTPTWSDWDFVIGELPLDLGPNMITLVWSEGDTGWVNIDYVEIN